MGHSIILAIAGLLWINGLAYAATLLTPDQVTARGQMAITTIALVTEGEAIGGLQFDIEWAPELDLKLVAGDLVRQSSKILHTASVAPGVLRCLLVGMNLDVLADGELLKVFIFVDPGAAAGVAQIRFKNVIAARPDGEAVPLHSGSIAVGIEKRNPTLSLQPEGVLNAASLLPGPVSPGEIVTLFAYIPATSPAVLINGIEAPVISRSPNQLNMVVPFGIGLSEPATLEIRMGGQTLGNISVPVAPVTPAIFAQTGTGGGPGAILNQDFTPNSFSNPAARGSTIFLYGTGFGLLNPSGVDGRIATEPASTVVPVTAQIAGVPAEVTYAGAVPGLIAGAVQINVRIPGDVPPSLEAPVFLGIGSVTTPMLVTVSIQ